MELFHAPAITLLYQTKPCRIVLLTGFHSKRIYLLRVCRLLHHFIAVPSTQYACLLSFTLTHCHCPLHAGLLIKSEQDVGYQTYTEM